MIDSGILIKGDRWTLVEDNDGHWYVVPKARLKEFYAWVGSEEAELGGTPEYAKSVGGSPSLVSFRDFEIE